MPMLTMRPEIIAGPTLRIWNALYVPPPPPAPPAPRPPPCPPPRPCAPPPPPPPPPRCARVLGTIARAIKETATAANRKRRWSDFTESTSLWNFCSNASDRRAGPVYYYRSEHPMVLQTRGGVARFLRI